MDGATNDINNVILSRPTPPDVTTPQTPPRIHHNGGGGGGQTTPPSPFTDTSSSALAPSASAAASATGTPYTDLTSLPSDVSKLSLGPAKKPSLTEPPAASWPYSHSAALGDIPGIAYALHTFLKSQMVESEEYCHRVDPRKCVSFIHHDTRRRPPIPFPPFVFCKNPSCSLTPTASSILILS
jgi:hypothetical protein